MPLPPSAARHQAQQQRITLAAVLGARRTWAGMGADWSTSWLSGGVGAKLWLLAIAAQTAAARDSIDALDRMTAELGLPDELAGTVNTDALTGVTGDGRDVEPLLYGAVTHAKEAVTGGATATEALDAGGKWLDGAITTLVADTGRAAMAVGMTARPHVTGWVRMLNPPSCSRCALLAGRRYSWKADFDRHNHCDCTAIPAGEDVEGDPTTDPRAYFHSLSTQDQDRVFTKAGAESIRLGADIGQVVNARRGGLGLAPVGSRITAQEARMLRGGRDRGRLQRVDVYGRQLEVTTEGVTIRGVAGSRLAAKGGTTRDRGARTRSAKVPRLMPEAILSIAEDRDDAIRLLRRYGYVL